MVDSQKYKPLLHGNPLCGIDTYKDALNLATGACTRAIKKIVLTGEENWSVSSGTTVYYVNDLVSDYLREAKKVTVCSHYNTQINTNSASNVGSNTLCFRNSSDRLYINSPTHATTTDFTTFLQQQYSAGTPVTVWYVLATPTTETITVPTGLSGTEEGYLAQSSTPTPTNPVYPTANEVLIWLHSLRELTTATETFTTLPADIYADGTNATLTLKGNTIQNGTPTPDNPIMPQGTGERTENLINVQPFTIEADSASHNIVLWSGTLPVGTYTVSLNQDNTLTTALRNTIRLIIGGTNYYESANENYHLQSGQHKMTFTISDATQTVEIRYWGNTLSNDCTYSNIMFNTGSTALPYEPYGYKIPISSANTTTPVYLGEVETTRKIKKLVFDGTEKWNWYETTASGVGVGIALSDMLSNSRTNGWCTHFTPQISPSSSAIDGVTFGASNTVLYITFSVETATALNLTDTTSVKTWLQQQYAAGTPVTVWYVLATEETAVVNEPLCKIGNYADTVSDITVPTITGKDTFDVDTTLKPSEVSLSYTGWHDATVKEWDGSDWQ